MEAKQYKKGKPQKEKNIRRVLSCSCEKKADKKYDVLHGWGSKVQYTFNEAGLPVEEQSLHIMSGRKESKKFVYLTDGTLQRKEVAITEDGAYKGINASVFKIPEIKVGLHEWQLRKGVYKLNSKDELVYEAIDMKYREKVNGVWSGWKKTNFCGVK